MPLTTTDTTTHASYGWQHDFSASMNDDGSWELTATYIAPYPAKYTPPVGTPCHISQFSDLYLVSYELANLGNLWQTTAHFYKPPTDQISDNEAPEETSAIDAQFDPNSPTTTWNFSTSLTQKSIFDHPSLAPYFDMDDATKALKEALLSGRISISDLIKGSITRTDPTDLGIPRSANINQMIQFLENIHLKGISAYLTPSSSYSITSTKNQSSDATLDKLITAAGGNFRQTSQETTTINHTTQITTSASQILDKSILILD